MKKLLALVITLAVFAWGLACAAEKPDSKIQEECQKAAKTQKVPKDKLQDFMAKCIKEKKAGK